MVLGLGFVCFVENFLKSRCEMFKDSNGGKGYVISEAKGGRIGFVGIGSFGHNFVSCEAKEKFTDYSLWSGILASIISARNSMRCINIVYRDICTHFSEQSYTYSASFICRFVKAYSGTLTRREIVRANAS